MKLLLIATLPLVTGCFIGDAAVPIVCSTDLPGTQYSIYLHGPHEVGYFYTIETPDGDCGWRELGHVTLDESASPQLEDLGNGVFRVTWSNAPNPIFTTIDTTQKRIVADSNEFSAKNTPFDTPRYLRPEYAELREYRDRSQ